MSVTLTGLPVFVFSNYAAGFGVEVVQETATRSAGFDLAASDAVAMNVLDGDEFFSLDPAAQGLALIAMERLGGVGRFVESGRFLAAPLHGAAPGGFRAADSSKTGGASLAVHKPTDSLAASVQSLLALRKEVDYQSIARDHRVLFLGELHHSEPIRHEVVHLIPLLKQMGFTHLAMEMFHSATQRCLDYYAQGRTDRDHVIKQDMVSHRNTQYFDDPDCFPPDPAMYGPYFEIVDAAVRGGLTVLGIEWCRYDGETLNAHQGFGERCRRLGLKYAPLGLTPEVLMEIAGQGGSRVGLASEEYWDIFEQHLPTRNEHAAGILAKALKIPGAKIAVLGGQKHYGSLTGIRNQITLNRFLEASTEIRGPVVYFAVAEREKESSRHRDGPNISKALFEAAHDAGFGKERFMVPTTPNPDFDTPDYIVHLPTRGQVSS